MQFKPMSNKDILYTTLETKEQLGRIRGGSFGVTMLKRFNESTCEKNPIKSIKRKRHNNYEKQLIDEKLKLRIGNEALKSKSLGIT